MPSAAQSAISLAPSDSANVKPNDKTVDVALCKAIHCNTAGTYDLYQPNTKGAGGGFGWNTQFVMVSGGVYSYRATRIRVNGTQANVTAGDVVFIY